MIAPATQIQGITCFAPPLTTGKLDAYKDLALQCEDRRCRQEMLALIEMLEVFRQTPPSKLQSFMHPIGVLESTGRSPAVVPLDPQEIERIEGHVPGDSDCDLISSVFDRLTGDTRNAAYHLLWFARELSQNREPITQDKL